MSSGHRRDSRYYSTSHRKCASISVVVLLAVAIILPATVQVDAFILHSSRSSSSRKAQALYVKSPSAPITVNSSGEGFAQPIKKKMTKPEEYDANGHDDDAASFMDMDMDMDNNILADTNTSTDDDMEIQKELILKMNPTQLKEKLLSLLPRMTGTPEEFRLVEQYVNALEDKFIAPQTLDFFNLASVGEWQFLFTTNQLGRPSPKLRLTELIQSVEVSGFDGVLTNRASWDLAQDGITFDARGTFASALPYKINQGARMTLAPSDDHNLQIELSKGSAVPDDTEGLVGLIHRAMPTELFDASDLAIDTTYLDTDIRIVRFTGVRHEGVRNIFMRKGLIEINPSGMD